MTHQLKTKFIHLLLHYVVKTESPSLQCAKFITSPVCSWDDAASGIYETDGCIVSVSEYICDVYANALKNVSLNKCRVKKHISGVLDT